jgi:hypothetical protein
LSWWVSAGINAFDSGTCRVSVVTDSPALQGNELIGELDTTCSISNFTQPGGGPIAPTPLQTGPPIPPCFPLFGSCVARSGTGLDLIAVVTSIFIALLLIAIIGLCWQRDLRKRQEEAAEAEIRHEKELAELTRRRATIAKS